MAETNLRLTLLVLALFTTPILKELHELNGVQFFPLALRISLHPSSTVLAYPQVGTSGETARWAGLWVPVDLTTPAGHLFQIQENLLFWGTGLLILTLISAICAMTARRWLYLLFSAVGAAVLATALWIGHALEGSRWIPAVLAGLNLNVLGTASEFGSEVRVEMPAEGLPFLLVLIGWLALDVTAFAVRRCRERTVPPQNEPLVYP